MEYGALRSCSPVMWASNERFSVRSSRNSSSAQPDNMDGVNAGTQAPPTASTAHTAKVDIRLVAF
jgi:hypothetical protein